MLRLVVWLLLVFHLEHYHSAAIPDPNATTTVAKVASVNVTASTTPAMNNPNQNWTTDPNTTVLGGMKTMTTRTTLSPEEVAKKVIGFWIVVGLAIALMSALIMSVIICAFIRVRKHNELLTNVLFPDQ
uniref:Col_cuticle_N domain-containing protein n=1 Tax=Steinernema glaseri TaxID=37863 RepID=A0A1I8A5I5_9BILA